MLSDHVHLLVNTTDCNKLIFANFRYDYTSNRLKDGNKNGTQNVYEPFKDEAQTALFKAPVRTAQ